MFKIFPTLPIRADREGKRGCAEARGNWYNWHTPLQTRQRVAWKQMRWRWCWSCSWSWWWWDPWSMTSRASFDRIFYLFTFGWSNFLSEVQVWFFRLQPPQFLICFIHHHILFFIHQSIFFFIHHQLFLSTIIFFFIHHHIFLTTIIFFIRQHIFVILNHTFLSTIILFFIHHHTFFIYHHIFLPRNRYLAPLPWQRNMFKSIFMIKFFLLWTVYLISLKRWMGL